MNYLNLGLEPISVPGSSKKLKAPRHKLETTTMVDNRKRKVRRRCMYCYEKLMKDGVGSKVARNDSKKVTTFCSVCDEKRIVCLPCFGEIHSRL